MLFVIKTLKVDAEETTLVAAHVTCNLRGSKTDFWNPSKTIF